MVGLKEAHMKRSVLRSLFFGFGALGLALSLVSASCGGDDGGGLGGAGGAGGAGGQGGAGGAGGAGGTGGSGGSGGGGIKPGDPEQTIDMVFVTWYGFNDNSCQIETQHDCNTIAYAKMDGYATAHDEATEGTGTYDDPITAAGAANDEGDSGAILPGTKVYFPYLKKYFIVEDQCAECNTDWKKGLWRLDLWMGPSVSQDNPAMLNDCEDTLTRGDQGKGTGTIIVNPKNSYEVEMSPIFKDGACTTHTF
jgi:hypothetical protein